MGLGDWIKEQLFGNTGDQNAAVNMPVPGIVNRQPSQVVQPQPTPQEQRMINMLPSASDDSMYMDEVYRQQQQDVTQPSTFSKIMSGVGNIPSNISNWAQENPNLASSAAGLASGVGGYLWSKGDYEKALADTENAARMAGTYEALGPSQVAGIADDPALKGMQMQALQRIQQEALTGTTPEDEAYRRQQQNKINQEFQARAQEADINNQRKGVQAGSGLAMAQAMSNNQQALNQAANASDADITRKAEARRNATQQLASQSGQMQQEQFNRNLQRASATDAFNQANAQNKMGAARSQAGLMQNVAQARNQLGSNKASTATAAGNVVATGIQNNANQKQNNNLMSTVKSGVVEGIKQKGLDFFKKFS